MSHTASARVLPSADKRSVPRKERAVSARPQVNQPTHTSPPLTQCQNQDGSTIQELDRFRASFTSTPVERALFIPLDSIQGTIPKDLKGTLLRNGPANFKFGGTTKSSTLQHPLEGDGAVTAFAFSNGEVFMRRRFIRTESLQAEMAAGRQLRRGVHTTVGQPGVPLSWPFGINLRQPANSAVLHWAGKVLALYERDLPYVMDRALTTSAASRGPSTLNVWHNNDVMASHYRITVEEDGSKRLCTWGALESGSDLVVKFLELDEACNKVAETHHTIPGATLTFVHDILVTENYYVLAENPTRMNFWKLASDYMFNKASLAECLQADAGGRMKIHCVPRPGKDGRMRPVYETAQPLFSVHHVNAWEADSCTIVVDTLARDTAHFAASDFTSLSSFETPEEATTMRRLVMRGTALDCRQFDTRTVTGLEGRSFNFPSLLPPKCTGQPHQAVFVVASKATSDGSSGLGQCILKLHVPIGAGVDEPWDASAVTVQEYFPGDMRYAGEPVFVPKANSEVGESFTGNNGYLLVQVNDLSKEGNERTCMEILDASDIAAGPLVTIHLQELVPPGLHGSWTDTYLGPTPNETIPMSNDIRYQL